MNTEQRIVILQILERIGSGIDVPEALELIKAVLRSPKPIKKAKLKRKE